MEQDKTEHKETSTPTLPEPLLDQKEVSTIIKKSESFLEKARWVGHGGPKFLKIGKSVRYRPSDVREFIDLQPVHTSTTQIENRKTVQGGIAQ